MDGPSSFGALAANAAGGIDVEVDVDVDVDENNSVVVVLVKEGRDVEMEGEKAKTFLLVVLQANSVSMRKWFFDSLAKIIFYSELCYDNVSSKT